MDNFGDTNITRPGLLILCRLNLAFLGIGKVIIHEGSNSYGDEGALLAARYFPRLLDLWTPENELGWEGIVAIAKILSKLEILSIQNNRRAG